MTRGPFSLTYPGWVIAGAVVLLAAIGLACIYVTDTHYAAGNDGPKNATKQAAAIVVGLFASMVILRLGYARIARFAYIFFALAVLLLLLPLAAKLTHSTMGGFVHPRNGAYRWINLPGFQLQPSELMKVAYILALAWYLRFRGSYRRFGGLMLPFLISIIPAALILLQPDLGMVMLLLPVLFIMLFIAGARLSHLGVILLLGLAAAPLAWSQIHHYQRMRIVAVLFQSEELRQAVIEHPEAYRKLATRRQAIEWAAGSGYQLVHSKNAIGSGGVLGNGWGEGIYVENPLLPDRHNDFVMAVVGHQWGLAGCLFVLICYAAMVLAGAAIASGTTDPVGRLLATGVTALLAAQVIINVGMAVGLMPITGMTLPFVSYGGSSLVSNMVAVALLVSVSQFRPYMLSPKAFDFAVPHRERAMLIEQTTAESPRPNEKTSKRRPQAAPAP